MMASSLLGVFSSDPAMPVGPLSTLVFARNQGIVVNEPCIVAMRMDSSGIEALGAVCYQVQDCET